ncbi:Na+/H+ antiporter NhaA [Streptomyces sp. NPDC127114]|uniref:Na+/H+ antiporter NhaA n=1 Tax=Streptomyces sp. NPDC127114 TaxID=3345366 RepID=UPI003626F8BB
MGGRLRPGRPRSIGFTVALLLGQLSFADPTETEHVKAAVLLGSVTAATLAALLLRRRHGAYKRLYEAEERDDNADGTPTSARPASRAAIGDHRGRP